MSNLYLPLLNNNFHHFPLRISKFDLSTNIGPATNNDSPDKSSEKWSLTESLHLFYLFVFFLLFYYLVLRYITVAKAVIYYFLPLSIIGILYVLMARRLHLSARDIPGELAGPQRAQARARRHVARMVVTFVIGKCGKWEARERFNYVYLLIHFSAVASCHLIRSLRWDFVFTFSHSFCLVSKTKERILR